MADVKQAEIILYSFKLQRIDYYFKQAKNLLLPKGERIIYINELSRLVSTL